MAGLFICTTCTKQVNGSRPVGTTVFFLNAVVRERVPSRGGLSGGSSPSRAFPLFRGYPYLAYLEQGYIYILLEPGSRMAEHVAAVVLFKGSVEPMNEPLDGKTSLAGEDLIIDENKYRLEWICYDAASGTSKLSFQPNFARVHLSFDAILSGTELIAVDLQLLPTGSREALTSGDCSLGVFYQPSGKIHILCPAQLLSGNGQ
jgi:hypothetical protein